jgi:ABC-type polysaccharide/polyol phosphate transport system ATPase subunit/ABC-type polysaccharide/polyol phosphate export permease
MTASILGRRDSIARTYITDSVRGAARYRRSVAVEGSTGSVAAGRSGSDGAPAVSVRSVSKTFLLPRHRAWTLKERMRHPIASLGHDRLEALRDVSFDVRRGEFFAVIGRNGSGKSTLLRSIAGIYELDGGEVRVGGRLAPFIELGVGFHPQLDAPDNVAVAGTLMGLRPSEARRRYPEVISFAELEEFADMPLANYSSGMQVRLAFSTTFQVDADVLLFDEVLAVGDALFRLKCMETFERLISRGHTIIYVTHSLDTVSRFADRALLLERGRAVSLGEPGEVIEEYERRNRERERNRRIRVGESNGYAEVMGAWLETEEGDRVTDLRQGDHASFRFVIRLREDMERPIMGFAVRDSEERVIVSETDRWRTQRRRLGRAGETQAFTALLPSSLDPGAYDVLPLLAPASEEGLFSVPGNEVRVRVEPAGPDSERLPFQPEVDGGGAPARSVRRFVDVCLTLAKVEFKLRYLNSVIGYVWALAQPLLLFAVLYLLWSQVFGRGSDVPHYALKLLIGIALFTFFTEATGHALGSLVGKGGMLRKIPFPPVALPLSSVLTSSFLFGLSMLVVFGFVLANGIAPSADWIELVPLFALLIVFTTGASLLLSLVYVPVRDVQPVWVVISRLLFFLTPIFYPIDLVPDDLRRLLMINPLSVVIVQADHVILDQTAPTAAEVAGGTGWLAIAVGFSTALLAAGLWLYATRARRLAERI